MILRYPHTGTITLKVGTLASGETDTGIIGRDKWKDEVYELSGRFEDASGHGGGYTAKFYARHSSVLDYISNDNAKMTVMGRSFDVVRLVPYQTHTEIWLS
jgi:hypothetical protein